MIKKILLTIYLFANIISWESTAIAETINDDFKAAFIRNDDLWIKLGNKEWKITNGDYVRYPKWSHDGYWIAYLKGTKESGNPLYNGDLWLYNIKMNKHFKAKTNVQNNFQWSPRQNKISFLVGKTLFSLNTAHPRSFLNIQIAQNIESFSWLPDGGGFLIASKESERLDSDIILSKVSLRLNLHKPVIKHFYTVPVGENEYYVSTSQFKWSLDKKWISFLLIPTASLSADSNTLCILSNNGQVFQRVDEMLNYEEWFQWEPAKSFLGYISGVGREADINKKLKLVMVPVLQKNIFTPKGYADQNLFWENDNTIFVSRSKEGKGLDLDKRPLPSIYRINISSHNQKQITFPSKKEGDFSPQFFHNHLIWVRSDTQKANILISETNNMNGHQWIKNVTVGSSYYAKWNWNEVFSLYTDRVEGK